MAQKIKILAMDVDGTLTDGKIYMGAEGELCKAFHIKDGLGIVKLKKQGIIPVIITGRVSQIVANRAKELGIEEVYQGVEDKGAVLKELVDKYGITLDKTAYIGDDCNDLGVMEIAGITFAPADAVREVREYVDVTVESRGGEGAVRDVVEYLLKM